MRASLAEGESVTREGRETKCLSILVVVAALVAGSISPLFAGECVESRKFYVAVLEEGPAEPGFEYAFYCLGSNPLIDGRLWAGPTTAARFRELRADSLRDRISSVVSTLLASAWAESADHRHRLIQVAARAGVAKLGTLDVFTELVGSSEKPYYGLYEELALLQDCRSVDYMQRRYEQLRRGAPEVYSEEILDLLSGLYHIPCKRAVEVALQLEAQETDGRLRERLRRVIDRE